KHVKPLVETVLLVENPSTRGFTTLSAQLPDQSVRLERAHCLQHRELFDEHTAFPVELAAAA
ncbi:hypothetical protein ACWCQZ_51415, partial [Streptomyces sp. NPDC002285]